MESFDYYSLFFQDGDTTNSTLNHGYGDDDEFTDQDEIIVLSVSAGILVLILFLILCCCCSAGCAAWVDKIINSAADSDGEYAERALRRVEAEKEKKKEDPAVRRQKLLNSFDKNKVTMVITKDSYVKEEKVLLKENHDQVSDSSIGTNSTHSDHGSSDEEDEPNEKTIISSPLPVFDDIESNDEPKEIYLNTTRKNSKECKRKVPNSCAICLCSYDIDDVVVWSSNKECTHAFHDECILQWLVKNQNGECPCCRTNFTDLPPPGEKMKKERPSLPQSFRGWRLRYNFLSQRENPSEESSGSETTTTTTTAAVTTTTTAATNATVADNGYHVV